MEQMKMIINENNELVVEEVESLWDKALRFCDSILVYTEEENMGYIASNISTDYISIPSEGYCKTLELFEKVKNVLRKRAKPLVVFSNAIFLMPQFRWHEKLEGFPVFLATFNNGHFVLKNVQELTDKELRPGYDIERIYRNGGFELWDY